MSEIEIKDFELPKLENKLVEHRLEIEDKRAALDIEIQKYEQNTQWNSCCCNKTDSRLLKYILRYCIIVMVTSFSLYKLNEAEDCAQETTYISLLTFVVGLVIPN